MGEFEEKNYHFILGFLIFLHCMLYLIFLPTLRLCVIIIIIIKVT